MTTGPPVIGARYRLINRLAQGGVGTVYRAVDRLSGHVVTLKRLGVEAQEPGGSVAVRTTLAREFHLLASLRHPNVITVLDYGFDDDGAPFLTMDLEENARTIVAAGAAAPAAVQVDLLVQTLRALRYLHRLGIVHRDLKPQNVLVVGEQVKVLDFGLSVSRALPVPEDAAWAGTVAYMAPELLQGAAASERSDLYAFGMIAYELALGEYPLKAPGAMGLYAAIVDTPLPRPGDAIDPRLRPVLQGLLAKRPGDRFRDAGEVAEALARAFGQPLALETVVTRESVLQTTPLVGRDEPLARLDAALRAAIGGHGGTWLIGGESGVGKSRLLDEMRTRALIAGAVVGVGQAVSQGSAPYRVWRDVVSTLLLRVEVSDAEAEALAAIVPDVGELLGRSLPRAPAEDAEAAQTRLFLTVEALFRRQPRPVVVVLDDLQWAGSESRRLLAWLTRPAGTQAVLLLAGYRDDEAADLPDEVPGAQVLPLQRLTRAEVGEVAQAMIGPAAERPDLLDFLARETEGIPFFVVEVVRALAEHAGALDRVGATGLPSRVASGGIEKVVRRRLAQLPAAAMAVLQTAAVAGRRIDEAVLRALHPGLDVDAWLTTCARSAVLERRDQHWAFCHDKLREQLLDDLPAASRREIHRRIAECMERLTAERSDRSAALAHHWREAGDEAREASHAVDAGMQALQTGACPEAVAYLLRAREILAPAVRMPGARAAGGRGLWRGLDPNARTDPSSPGFVLGRIEGGLAEAHFRMGDLKTCREHCERALRAFGCAVPQSAAGWTAATLRQGLLRLTQATFRVRAADPEQSRLVAGEAARVQLRLTETFFFALRLPAIVWSSLRLINQCEPAGPLPELAQGYVILALLASAVPLPRLADAWGRRALHVAEQVALPRNVAWVRSRLAVHQMSHCRWVDADTGLRLAGAAAERLSDLRLWEETHTQRALASNYVGHFSQALGLSREARTLSRRHGNRQIESWALYSEALAQSRLGRDGEAVGLCEEALASLDEDVFKTEMISVLGVLALARLRTGQAMGAYEAADRTAWLLRTTVPIVYWLQPGVAGAAEVLLTQREARWRPTAAIGVSIPARSREVVRALRRFARHVPLGRAQAELWGGLADWLDGRRRRALRRWTRVTLLAEQMGLPYERARAHFEIGRHLPPDAVDRRQHLNRAADLFERLGSETDLAAVRREEAGGGAPEAPCP